MTLFRILSSEWLKTKRTAVRLIIFAAFDLETYIQIKRVGSVDSGDYSGVYLWTPDPLEIHTILIHLIFQSIYISSQLSNFSK